MTKPKTQLMTPATISQKAVWLKAVLRDKTLNASAKNVATALFLHHNQETGRCLVRQETLAKGLGLSRIYVNRCVAALVAGGWVSTEGTLGANKYRLNIDRAETLAEAIPDDETGPEMYPTEHTAGPEVCPVVYTECAQLITPSVPNSLHPVCPTEHTELPLELPKGTASLNSGPAEAERGIEIEPREIAQATAIALPAGPETTPPKPANDDTPGCGVVEISGLKIPKAKYDEWVAVFVDTNVSKGIMKRAGWARGLQPEKRRLAALQTELAKMDDEARVARLSRSENRAAAALTPARPAPPNRFQINTTTADPITFTGRNVYFYRSELDRFAADFPGMDIGAALAAFDAGLGITDRQASENRPLVTAFLRERSADAQARKAA